MGCPIQQMASFGFAPTVYPANNSRRQWVASMSRLRDFALGMVFAAMGVAAFFQMVQVDPVWHFVTISALSAISILAAGVLFVLAFSPRE
jgi:hypothetical protein